MIQIKFQYDYAERRYVVLSWVFVDKLHKTPISLDENIKYGTFSDEALPTLFITSCHQYSYDFDKKRFKRTFSTPQFGMPTAPPE